MNVQRITFQAARIMIKKIEQLLTGNKSFTFETTLSGLSYLKFIKEAKEKGYGITFFFVYLNSVELAKSRVALRVSKGGHNIPNDVITRRYGKGIINFLKYALLADDWYLYDNSASDYQLVAKSISGEKEISNFELYNKITGDGN